jgi:hypothetical protein
MKQISFALENDRTRDTSERYIAKSNSWIVMVSPNAPEGLFERMEKEPESICLYERLFLDYTVGLGRIYSEAEIAAAKESQSFEREYNLKYLGLIGTSNHHSQTIMHQINRVSNTLCFNCHLSHLVLLDFR